MIAGDQQKSVVCPACRETTALPFGGIVKLQTNFYFNQMQDVMSSSEFKQRTNAKLVSRCCSRHSNQSAEFFCNSCELILCKDCQSDDHNGHRISSIEEALLEQRRLMESELSSSFQCILTSSRITKSLENEARSLLASKQQAEHDIHILFSKYKETLRIRKNQLLCELSRLYAERSNVSVRKLEEAKNLSMSLGGIVQSCREALISASVESLLAYRAKLASKIQTSQPNDIPHEVPIDNRLEFTDGNEENLMNEIANIGRIICDKQMPCGLNVKEVNAVACQTSSITLAVTDLNGSEIGDQLLLDFEIFDAHNDLMECSVDRRSDGNYIVAFHPQISGNHRVITKFCYHTLAVSTVIVRCNDPVLVFGRKDLEQEEEEMQYPRDVAVDSSGKVYIADSGNGRILKYDEYGTLLLEFPISDADNEDYSSCSLVIDNQSGMIVCPEVLFQGGDLTESHSLLKYTLDGKLVSRVSHRDTLCQGLSLAINSRGQTIVADIQKNAIFVFDAEGRFLKRFGETGIEPGQFRRPTFICVGRNDSIVVSDSDNNRIQVFDKTGKFLYSFGAKGTGKGQLSLPFGVAVDRFENIVVVDGANNRIQIFRSGGQFLGCIESFGDRMNAPRGIDVTLDGYIYVADRDNHCVKKFKYL